MERGLLWLPLLGLFIWLAWAGWNEYQKVEAYKRWANQFQRAKYDIYAVLGQRDDELVWGKPTRSDPIDVQSVKLGNVTSVHLMVAGQPVPMFDLPDLATVAAASSDPAPSQSTEQDAANAQRGKVTIQFQLISGESRDVPFTDRTIAEQWYRFLAPRIAAQQNTQ